MECEVMQFEILPTKVEQERANRESNVFQKLNREQKKQYIQQLITSYRVHITCSKEDIETGFEHSAEIHKENAVDNLISLRAILSKVCFNDILGDL